jgi:2-polyprenyl-3-methyl-5-hydroxy-6-metoxy-1,4-benzoquinol methylase
MPVAADPEGKSAKILQDFLKFTDKRVLEIGCGKGRLTFAFAEHAKHVTAIDPVAEDIQTAKQNTPPSLEGKIDFIAVGIEDYLLPETQEKFDIALFTWSL